MKNRILLATDQSPEVAGALRLTRLLAEKKACDVEVVSVVEPIPVFGASAAELVAFTRAELEGVGRQSVYRRVQRTLAELGPVAAAWPVMVEVGAPAPTIVRVAQQQDASMIVLGQGRHAISDRWLGSETALRVMRLAHVPVLAVPATASALPSTAVLGLDFTELSLGAADAALEVLDEAPEIHLAHVLDTPSEVMWAAGDEWVQAQREQVVQRLETTRRELQQRTTGRVHVHVLDGDPAAELLWLAERVEAGLIAAGSHGSGFFGRILMGSVSTRLVRRAAIPVLISPPRTVPAEVERAATVPAVRIVDVDPGSARAGIP